MKAILIFILDLFVFDNLYGPGGFIYTIDKMFFMKMTIITIIYIIDPWMIKKWYDQSKE